MVSLGLGFFRVSFRVSLLGFLSGFLIRISERSNGFL